MYLINQYFIAKLILNLFHEELKKLSNKTD